MTADQAKKGLLELQSELQAYKNACSLLYYDESTAAPKKSLESRKQMLAVLESAGRKRMADKNTRILLDYCQEHGEVLDWREKRMLELLLRSEEDVGKIPQEEYIKYQGLRMTAYDVWHSAKAQNDFGMLKPYLEEIFAVKKRFGEYMDPHKKPYDVWLNLHERGLTMEKCDLLFDRLKAKVAPMIARIQELEPIPDCITKPGYSAKEQKKLADYVLAVMGVDKDHCVLAESEHPGTISFGKYDVRITTRYRADSFLPAMSMVMHEGGHALYELHTSDEDVFTCLGTYASMGVHESQSRLFENLIGRSMAFYQLITPKLRELFPEQLGNYTAEDLYRSANRCEVSPIRLEADELTYSMHIIIRYELEKAIFDGGLKVKDLSGSWNELYGRYLGIEIQSDREGVLQDSHWAYGSIGYFSSYALGNAYGAQIMQEMSRAVPVEQSIQDGNFMPVLAWLEKRLWRHGARYDPDELLGRIFGGPFNPDIYTDYLIKKYSELYSVR